MSTKFKTAYGKKTRVSIKFKNPSLTKQSFKDECDINNIMKKWQRTGLIDHVNEHKGDYGDLTTYDDYHASMNAILDARESFETLPSGVRKEFDNDPSKFLKFVHDPKNADAMVEMGLAQKRPVTPPVPVPPVSATPTPEVVEKATEAPSEAVSTET